MAFELPILDFMGHRRTAAAASSLLVVTTVAALALGGINRGLDFTGGALVEVGFAGPVEPAAARSVLDEAGLAGGVVQNYGSETELLVRMPPVTGWISRTWAPKWRRPLRRRIRASISGVPNSWGPRWARSSRRRAAWRSSWRSAR